MSPSEPYIPTPEDIEWAVHTMNLLKDGGIWAFPATGMLFKVDHYNHQLTLINESAKYETVTNFEMYRRTVVVFKFIGYTVK